MSEETPCYVWWRGGTLEQFSSRERAMQEVRVMDYRSVIGAVYDDIEEAVRDIARDIASRSGSREWRVATRPSIGERTVIFDQLPHFDGIWKMPNPTNRKLPLFLVYYDRDDGGYFIGIWKEKSGWKKSREIPLEGVVTYLESELTSYGALRWQLGEVADLLDAAYRKRGNSRESGEPLTHAAASALGYELLVMEKDIYRVLGRKPK